MKTALVTEKTLEKAIDGTCDTLVGLITSADEESRKRDISKFKTQEEIEKKFL